MEMISRLAIQGPNLFLLPFYESLFGTPVDYPLFPIAFRLEISSSFNKRFQKTKKHYLLGFHAFLRIRKELDENE